MLCLQFSVYFSIVWLCSVYSQKLHMFRGVAFSEICSCRTFNWLKLSSFQLLHWPIRSLQPCSTPSLAAQACSDPHPLPWRWYLTRLVCYSPPYSHLPSIYTAHLSTQPVNPHFPSIYTARLTVRFCGCGQIYPSEFGKKRMAEEEERGPPELFDAKEDADSSEEEEDDRKVGTEGLTLLL